MSRFLVFCLPLWAAAFCLGCSAKEPPSAEDLEVARIEAQCEAVGKEISQRPIPSGLPSDWDRRIPLPAGAQVAHVGDSDGIVKNVDFEAPGDYRALNNFYLRELKQAGFDLGKPVTTETGFNVPFSTCGAMDTVSLYPDKQDSTRSSIRIVYQPKTSARARMSQSSATSQYIEGRHRAMDARGRGEPAPAPGF